MEAGERMMRMLLERCRLLADSPRMGRPRPELRARMRSYPAPPYLIFYRTGREDIYVMRFVHERRDLSRIFPPRKKR